MFTESDLNQFHGSESLTYLGKQLFKNVVLTEGAMFVGQNGATWALTHTASILLHNDSVRSYFNDERFVLVRFQKDTETNSGMAIYEDGNDNVLYSEEIPYTDLPVKELKFFVCANYLNANNPRDVFPTIMLPSEY